MRFHLDIDLGWISIVSLPRASTTIESHVNFTEFKSVSQAIFFSILNTKTFAKTIS